MTLNGFSSQYRNVFTNYRDLSACICISVVTSIITELGRWKTES